MPVSAWSRHLEPVGAKILAVFARALLVVFFATIPGARLRPLEIERVAPPLPREVKERDGALVVHVLTEGHVPLEGARVQALAVIDGRVHLADAASSSRAGTAQLLHLPHADHWIVADAPGRARAATRLAISAGSREIELVLPPEHHLVVDVRDEGGAPLAGAEVEVSGHDPLPLGARVDAAGHADVGRLGEGPFFVTARAPGFGADTQRGAHPGDVVTFHLKKLGTVIAHVVDAHEAPAAGAHVQIAGAALWPARSATTDAAGVVRIGELATGTYALRATRGAEASAIELGVPVHGGDSRDVTLRLAPGTFVAVRVVDGEGGGDVPRDDEPPIASAKVTLAESGLSPFPLEAVTDKDGRARLGPVAPGAATIDALADGYVGRAVEVADPPPAVVRLALERAGSLEGRVVDARGFPVDGATIEVVGTDFHGGPIDEDPRRQTFRAAHFRATLAGPAPLISAGELGVVPGPVPAIPHGPLPMGNDAPLGFAAPTLSSAPPAEPWVTRGDGTFHLAPCPPGRVRLLVRHPQYVEAMTDVVTLASGATAKIDVVLHAGGDVEGRVVDVDGRAVAGARIFAAAARGSLERTTRSADDGSFAFAALPEDVLLSVADADDLALVRARVAVHVAEGARQRVTITLPKAREPLVVHVKSARGAPVPTAQISASSLDPASPLRATVFTDERGEASVPSSRGLALRLEVMAPGFAPRAFLVEAGSDPKDLVLAAASSLDGEVRSSRRDPIAHAEVVVYTDLGARRATTGEDGVFHLQGLGSGPVRLLVRASGFAPAARDLKLPADTGDRPFDAGRIELVEGAAVEGEVTDERGDPVQGARIAQDRVPTYLAVGTTPRGVAVTDARGRFRLGELPEGSLTLEAYAPDLGRARVEGVRTVAGRTTDRVRFVLRRTEAAPKSATPPASGGVAVTLGVDNNDAVVLVAVAEGSAAERAGLAPGDVLLEIDGAKISDMIDARARLSGSLADDVVVRVRRGDQVSALRVPREAVRR